MIRLLRPHYGVRPTHSAFHALLRSLAESFGTIVVRRLLANHEDESLRAKSREERKRSRSGGVAWFSSLVVSAGRGSCELRAARYHSGASPPNKPMHPTADTTALIFTSGAGRRVIGSVRRLVAEHED